MKKKKVDTIKVTNVMLENPELFFEELTKPSNNKKKKLKIVEATFGHSDNIEIVFPTLKEQHETDYDASTTYNVDIPDFGDTLNDL